MKYEIGIDNIILTCDVHSHIKKSPDFHSWASDVDYCGYEDLEFTVVSALELDEDGLPFDLSSAEIDKLMADEWFVKLVEKELIMALQAEAEKESEE
jgi:hypothetical protein